MPAKNNEPYRTIKEYRLTFRIDNRASASQRHFLAYDAREALSIFANIILKSLFERSMYHGKKPLLTEAFIKKHDESFSKDKIKNTTSTTETSNHDFSTQKLVDEFMERVELLKIEEYNRWASRWYPLKLPLEEVTQEES
jgi:hypothetical protein